MLKSSAKMIPDLLSNLFALLQEVISRRIFSIFLGINKQF